MAAYRGRVTRLNFLVDFTDEIVGRADGRHALIPGIDFSRQLGFCRFAQFVRILAGFFCAVAMFRFQRGSGATVSLTVIESQIDNASDAGAYEFSGALLAD